MSVRTSIVVTAEELDAINACAQPGGLDQPIVAAQADHWVIQNGGHDPAEWVAAFRRLADRIEQAHTEFEAGDGSTVRIHQPDPDTPRDTEVAP